MIMLRIYGSMAEEKPVQFGTEKVREWLESGAGNGWEESGGSIFAAAPLTIVLKEDGDCPEEGYRLCRENNGFCLSASNPAGMMYGLMDLGRELVHKKGRIEKIRDRSVAPYVKKGESNLIFHWMPGLPAIRTLRILPLRRFRTYGTLASGRSIWMRWPSTIIMFLHSGLCPRFHPW